MIRHVQQAAAVGVHDAVGTVGRPVVPEDGSPAGAAGRRAFRAPRSAPPLVILRTIADRQVIVAASDRAAAFGVRRGGGHDAHQGPLALRPDVRHAEQDAVRDDKALVAARPPDDALSPVVAIGRDGDGDHEHRPASASASARGRRSGRGGRRGRATRRALPRRHRLRAVRRPGQPRAAGACGSSGNGRDGARGRRADAQGGVGGGVGRRRGRRDHRGRRRRAHDRGRPRLAAARRPALGRDVAAAAAPPRAVDDRAGDGVAARRAAVAVRPRGWASGSTRRSAGCPSRSCRWSTSRRSRRRSSSTARLTRSRQSGPSSATCSAGRSRSSPAAAAARGGSTSTSSSTTPRRSARRSCSRAGRDPVKIFELFRCARRVEEGRGGVVEWWSGRVRIGTGGCGDDTLHPHHSTTPPPPSLPFEGFSGLRIVVAVHERVADEQVRLLDGETYAGQLEARPPRRALCAPPRRRRRRAPPSSSSRTSPSAWREGGKKWGVGEWSVGSRRLHPTPPPHPPLLHPRPRRSTSCRRPVEVRVVAEPCNDREGRPMQFTHDGRVHRLVNARSGPSASPASGGGHDKTRDYYDVAEPAGKRFWLFRVTETGGGTCTGDSRDAREVCGASNARR